MAFAAATGKHMMSRVDSQHASDNLAISVSRGPEVCSCCCGALLLAIPLTRSNLTASCPATPTGGDTHHVALRAHILNRTLTTISRRSEQCFHVYRAAALLWRAPWRWRYAS